MNKPHPKPSGGSSKINGKPATNWSATLANNLPLKYIRQSVCKVGQTPLVHLAHKEQGIPVGPTPIPVAWPGHSRPCRSNSPGRWEPVPKCGACWWRSWCCRVVPRYRWSWRRAPRWAATSHLWAKRRRGRENRRRYSWRWCPDPQSHSRSLSALLPEDGLRRR